MGELRAVGNVVEAALLRPGESLDVGFQSQGAPSSYATASSALAAMKKPMGRSCSSAR